MNTQYKPSTASEPLNSSIYERHPFLHRSQYVTNQWCTAPSTWLIHQLEEDVGCKILHYINNEDQEAFGYKILRRKDVVASFRENKASVTFCTMYVNMVTRPLYKKKEVSTPPDKMKHISPLQRHLFLPLTCRILKKETTISPPFCHDWQRVQEARKLRPRNIKMIKDDQGGTKNP